MATNKRISQRSTGTLHVTDDYFVSAKSGTNYKYNLTHLYSKLVDGTVPFTAIDIDGGTINNTIIGGTAPLAGTFTAITGTSVTDSGLTPTRVIFAGAGGLLTSAAGFEYNSGTSTLTVTNIGAVTSIDINGGTIDGTPIGAASASTGSFTTLATSGTATLASLSMTQTVNKIDTGTITTNLDTNLPTQKAVKTYVDNFVGSANIVTVGTITSGTWNGTDIAVADGGTGASTFTKYGVMLGNDAATLQVTAAGTANHYLRGNGAANPTFNELDISHDTTPTLGGNLSLNAKNLVSDAVTGTKIGTATTQLIGFWNQTPTSRPTALTPQIGILTGSAAGAPDYAIQDLVNPGFGFVTTEEAQSFVQAVINLQERVLDLESKLQTIGLIA